MNTPEQEFQTADQRACGWVLAIAAIISVAGMTYHPSTGGHGMEAVREIAREGTLASVVHGVMLVALGGLAFGFSGLTGAPGWRSPAARAAFTAYAFGMVSMGGAAVINGFAVNKVARGFLATGSENVELIRSQLITLSSLSSTLAQVAVGAQAIALGLWAVALWSKQRALATGALLAAAPTAAAALGLLPLSVHGYLAVVAAQAAWTIAVGVQLLRNRV